MKIFISWSGKLSKAVAERLRAWLRQMIHGLDPFVSSQDIEKGNVWLAELIKELEQSSIGILCLTRENLNSKWMLFEAGALFTSLGKSKIYPLLINITNLELDLPLSSFQATSIQKEDFYKLIKSIYQSLENRLISEQELEKQFNLLWGEMELDIKQLLSSATEETNELQDLTEQLLLPVIYREALAGDLETVFEWLRIAKLKRVANLEGHLGFVEASLARITGKRQAPASLKQLSIQNNYFSCKAHLELLFFNFAAGIRFNDSFVDVGLIENSPESVKRTGFAVLALWQLREKNKEKAYEFFSRSDPDNITNYASDYYRAIPMGILSFAFGKGDLGEQYFDLVRSDIMPNDGYPFISMVLEFDRMFVNRCIGFETGNIDDKRFRDLRGHIWVLIKYLDLICETQEILQTIVKRTQNWKVPLTKEVLVSKLTKLKKKYVSTSGREGPLVY
jgi:hypothetical protein